MSASGDAAEASSPGEVVRVQVGIGGRTMRVRLSPWAMRLSAAELANDVVCVNTLAAMRLQVAQNTRSPDELAAYETYVDWCCGIRRREPSADRMPAVGTTAKSPKFHGHERVGADVMARVKRIEAMLACVPATTEKNCGHSDLAVSADSGGRLTDLWLSQRCMRLASVAELEDVLNRAFANIKSPDRPGRLTRSA